MGRAKISITAPKHCSDWTLFSDKFWGARRGLAEVSNVCGDATFRDTHRRRRNSFVISVQRHQKCLPACLCEMALQNVGWPGMNVTIKKPQLSPFFSKK
jgi:hypothetical protein